MSPVKEAKIEERRTLGNKNTNTNEQVERRDAEMGIGCHNGKLNRKERKKF
jgi:hypothetical protein